LSKGSLDLFLCGLFDLLLNCYALVLRQGDFRPDFHGGRVAKGLPGNKFFRNHLRLCHGLQGMFIKCPRVGLFDEVGADLGGHLLAEVPFQQRAGHVSGTKAFYTGVVLERSIRFFELFPDTLGGDLKADLFLYRAEGFDENFHKQ
jgi:hypothetical protein